MESNKSEKLKESGKKNTEVKSVLRSGASGPLLFQNVIIHSKMAYFRRLRIIEQNLIGDSLILGKFSLSNAIPEYTKAKLFNGHEEIVKIAVKFSEVTGESTDSYLERNPAEFSIRFYTGDGEWNLIGKSLPVARTFETGNFSDSIYPQNNGISVNLANPTMFWDFMSLNPESLHYLLMLMSDRGTPVGYRHMNGYGVNTFTMVNDRDEKFFVKFHLKTLQGIRSFKGEEALENYGENKSFSHRDLIKAINEGDFPKWELKIQAMPVDHENNYYYNPFDHTKTWPKEHYPLIDVGEIELNEIPKKCTDEIVKSDFDLTHEIDGICLSSSNEPNNFDNNKEDHYTQPQELFTHAMNNYNRENLVVNIVDSMRKIEGDQRDAIINRQLSHFFRVDVELGSGIAIGLGVDFEDVLEELRKMEMELV